MRGVGAQQLARLTVLPVELDPQRQTVLLVDEAQQALRRRRPVALAPSLHHPDPASLQLRGLRDQPQSRATGQVEDTLDLLQLDAAPPQETLELLRAVDPAGPADLREVEVHLGIAIRRCDDEDPRVRQLFGRLHAHEYPPVPVLKAPPVDLGACLGDQALRILHAHHQGLDR